MSDDFVRPYFITAGRTTGGAGDLPIETMVSSTGANVATLEVEHRRVVDLCRSSLSIAEVSALLKLPVGVARVLVSDLAAAGYLDVHDAASSADISIVRRLLDGIRQRR